MTNPNFSNPFRPGAGHMPPYLAGREHEKKEFEQSLNQAPILKNFILTGLRGVGKTVLLETLKPLAKQKNWAWIGTDLSEASSLSEENLAIRLLTDLSVFTSTIVTSTRTQQGIGFIAQQTIVQDNLGYQLLEHYYKSTPGLVADKLKRVLELVWSCVDHKLINGIVFAYDEAQNLSDHGKKDQFPLSVLLDVFQSLQRKGLPYLLVLTGLPTLFPKLVEARTYAERMFHVETLDRLQNTDAIEAIQKPLEKSTAWRPFNDQSVQAITDISGGYPYFIQFVCREVFDLFIAQRQAGVASQVPATEIVQKLDTDFFSGRWGRATDRQRDLLMVIAQIESSETVDFEFTVQEIVQQSKTSQVKAFTASHTNQLLNALGELGLVYKNRHGKYSFAVPLLGRYIKRQHLLQRNLL